jgi:5'-nucleotidase
MTLTGAQILSLLERQWLGPEQSMLQVSRGFGYAWDPARPPGSRVVPDSVTIHGQPMRPDSFYRVTVNSFLAGGGDGIYVLREGRDRAAGPDAREALVRYIAERSPVAPSGERRIRNVGRRE